MLVHCLHSIITYVVCCSSLNDRKSTQLDGPSNATFYFVISLAESDYMNNLNHRGIQL